MKKIYLVTNYNGHIPQLTHETNGLNLELLAKYLSGRLIVKTIRFDDLANKIINCPDGIKDNYFFLTSSQIESYKMAILDVAFELVKLGGYLLPKYDLYLSHENKFHQELYKKRAKISSVSSTLVTNTNNIPEVDFPAVVKGYAGFGSKGVTLVNNRRELFKAISSNLNSYFFDKLDMTELMKSIFKSRFKYPGKYPNKIGRVIIQDFMPRLNHDWKILIFGNDIFALKRYVKDNDFKASGSGLFNFNERPSDQLIKFAVETFEKLDTPFISLDIAELDDEQFSVIEFQAVHFGLITALKCEQFYSIENGFVCVKKRNIDAIEPFFANAILRYIE